MKSTHHTQSCSFCGKPKEQNRRLIAGPGVFICSECVSLCNEIIAEETGRGPGEGRPAAPCPPGVGRASRWWQRSRPSADQAPSSLLELHSSEF